MSLNVALGMQRSATAAAYRGAVRCSSAVMLTVITTDGWTTAVAGRPVWSLD